MEIRSAQITDLPAMMDIYHEEVLRGTGTFDTEPFSDEKQRAWFRLHEDARYPLVVALEAGRVAGWGSLSAWSDRRAYHRTVEVSVYVESNHRNRGVGRALLEALIAQARAAGHRVLLARIAEGNTGSLRMFGRAGFTSIGVMRRVGEKHGRILDVTLMDLQLDS